VKPPIRVIIADDHPVVRGGLRRAIEADPSIKILHDAGSGDIALLLIRQDRPDVAILDVEMPVMDGFDVARAVREEQIPADIVFMTIHNDEETLHRALEAGVKGFVLKENAVSELLEAVHAVSAGKFFLSPTLSGLLMRRAGPGPRGSGGEIPLDALTPAERRILALVSELKTSQAIAEELFISLKTVEKHRSNICAKLNVHGSYALLKFAVQNKNAL